MLGMNESQNWALIAVVAVGMFGTITLVSTMFLRVMRTEFASVRTEITGMRSDIGELKTDVVRIHRRIDDLDRDVSAIYRHLLGTDHN